MGLAFNVDVDNLNVSKNKILTFLWSVSFCLISGLLSHVQKNTCTQCTHTYMHAQTHTHTCIQAYIHTLTNTHATVSWTLFSNTHAHVHIHMPTCTHGIHGHSQACTQSHTHTLTDMQMHTHVHMHRQTQRNDVVSGGCWGGGGLSVHYVTSLPCQTDTASKRIIG